MYTYQFGSRATHHVMTLKFLNSTAAATQLPLVRRVV